MKCGVDDQVPDGGRVVDFGAGYVFPVHHLSPGITARADGLLARFGWSDPYRAGRDNQDRAVAAVLAHSDDTLADDAFVGDPTG